MDHETWKHNVDFKCEYSEVNLEFVKEKRFKVHLRNLPDTQANSSDR